LNCLPKSDKELAELSNNVRRRFVNLSRIALPPYSFYTKQALTCRKVEPFSLTWETKYTLLIILQVSASVSDKKPHNG
jgi:hypothetical protein